VGLNHRWAGLERKAEREFSLPSRRGKIAKN